MDEQQAITKLKQRDISGLEELVNKYFLKAVRAAYLIVQDQYLAEDVVQTSFINLYKKIDQFDESKDFRPWFFRSVVNRAISVTRKRSRIVRWAETEDNENWLSNLEGISDNGRGLEDDFITGEISKTIWQALEKLTPKQRASIVMRYYLELSEKEISDELDQPKSTVKWSLHSARKKLKQILDPQKDDLYEAVEPQEEKK